MLKLLGWVFSLLGITNQEVTFHSLCLRISSFETSLYMYKNYSLLKPGVSLYKKNFVNILSWCQD